MPLSRSFQENVTILDDDKTEQTEKFSLHLRSNQARVFVNPRKAVVTITDDDGDPDDAGDPDDDDENSKRDLETFIYVDCISQTLCSLLIKYM